LVDIEDFGAVEATLVFAVLVLTAVRGIRVGNIGIAGGSAV